MGPFRIPIHCLTLCRTNEGTNNDKAKVVFIRKERREEEKENDELDAAAAPTENKRTEGEATENTGSLISIWHIVR